MSSSPRSASSENPGAAASSPAIAASAVNRARASATRVNRRLAAGRPFEVHTGMKPYRAGPGAPPTGGEKQYSRPKAAPVEGGPRGPTATRRPSGGLGPPRPRAPPPRPAEVCEVRARATTSPMEPSGAVPYTPGQRSAVMKDLPDPDPIAELRACAAEPFERARAMPPGVYTSEAFLARELDASSPANGSASAAPSALAEARRLPRPTSSPASRSSCCATTTAGCAPCPTSACTACRRCSKAPAARAASSAPTTPGPTISTAACAARPA